MKKIVFNNNYAQQTFQMMTDYELKNISYGSYHAKYMLSNYMFVNSEWLDFVKGVNEWLKDQDNAKCLFDSTYRYKNDPDDEEETEKSITKNELYGFGFLFDPSRLSNFDSDDNIAKYFQFWIDRGLVTDIADHRSMLSRVKWLDINSLGPKSKVDGSILYENTTPRKLNKTWKASDDNPDDNQMYLFRWFNSYSGYGNYSQLRLGPKEHTPFVAFRDLSNEDEEVYVKQLAWSAWTVGTDGSEADIEVDFLDEVDYFDSIAIRMMPPYVLA